LAKDRGGHLVNQPRLSLFDVLRNNSWRLNKHNKTTTTTTTKKRMNAEHGEENV